MRTITNRERVMMLIALFTPQELLAIQHGLEQLTSGKGYTFYKYQCPSDPLTIVELENLSLCFDHAEAHNNLLRDLMGGISG